MLKISLKKKKKMAKFVGFSKKKKKFKYFKDPIAELTPPHT